MENTIELLEHLLDNFASCNYKCERKVKRDFTIVKGAITSAFNFGTINQTEWNKLIDRAIDIKYAILLNIR